MIIKNIELINFRNYTSLDIEFSNGINYIVGDNAQGKTNLIEAIYTLSFAKSFKATSNEEMINKNALFATVKAKVDSGDFIKNVEIQFRKEGKRILVNSKPVQKLSGLVDIINVLSFTPKDTGMLKEAPKIRRNFLNSTISKFDKEYLSNLINFEKLLKERNDALKAPDINFNLIDVLTHQIVRISKLIYEARKKFIHEMNQILCDVYREISLNEENLKIKYKPFINPKSDYEEVALKLFKDNLENDIKRKATTIGIQREDFELYLGDRNLALYGSQGENRMSVIALKLAPYFLIKDETKLPVIVLDDVLSELDKTREESLIKFLANLNQVFITNTKRSEFCKDIYYICAENTLKKE